MQYRACMPVIAEADMAASTAAMSYKANSGMAVGKLMNVKITQNRSTVKAYGDDLVAEQINTFNYADVELDTTDIPENCEAVMYGANYAAAGQSTPETLTDSENDEGEYTGFGFVYCKRRNGQDVHKLYWLYKVKWQSPDDDFSTKKENVEFKNPTTKGQAFAGPDGKWRMRKTYASAAEAIAALKTLAKVPSA